ncbi:Hsp70 nucleotide exchange factor FES1 NDAI_0A07810 [Naumovozyma dairenensis CBS 421]|uniref:Hsp70 nucleotide exchange factor FES1 n=1 Tax=Naumovozyma dairenensis (strain ATCC 10597 / BCRC 20456 / CBS 421 / NBRC 0211 / NRRL Y-12639) TaxID=1071378 RepID=G0W547_NAUDC|nr:hypothetical protein NDAI_0A07810 [Naumovozyma dairenensis CBS 421]CCD22935.1 hypothetical protein NDAI_0A07810 [Naumovozyma dairenensis CBS 421]
MEKLLHWSIANSQNDEEAKQKAGTPDPRLLQQLFGGAGSSGPDDPTLMKQSIEVLMNPDVDVDTKLVAIDNFEMLIENLDNANNIENMKLWDPILKILDFEDLELRAAALSIIGTAVQNNVNSQNNFSKYDGSLNKVIALVNDKNQNLNVRIKALYALSNLVRNNKEIATEFEKLNGLDIISPILKDESAKTKLKMRAIALLTAFLTSVDINDDLISLLRKDGILETTINCLNTEIDLNLIDRVLNLLAQLIAAGIKFNEDELENLRTGFEKIESLKDRLNEDDYLVVKYVL